jgi:hypothetical protein
MSAWHSIKSRLKAAVAVAALSLAAHSAALAQCAMCKTAVAGSPDAGKLSESLNFAILILLIPPVLIFCGIFYAMMRLRKSRAAAGPEARPLRRRFWQGKLGLGRKGRDRKRRETGGAVA